MFISLETSRLYLKNITQEDRDFIFDQFSCASVTRYLFDAEPLTDISGADEIIDSYVQPEPRYQHRWILVRKSDNVKIGTCGYHRWHPNQGTIEVGYDLQEAYWGQGYMKEALQEIFDFAFRVMQVHEINACIYTENSQSLRLAEKLGFEKTGTMIEHFRGNDYLHGIYTLKK